jgi:hypothetical protein
MNRRKWMGLALLPAGAALVALALSHRPRPAEAPPLAEALRRAPGVARVEEPLISVNPSRHIVHLLDYRLVPRDVYGPDGYGEHLRRVEAVQEEHMALLRWLAAKRGVSEVFVEGLTEENLPAFFEKARAVDELAAAEIPRLAEQLADARERGAGHARAVENQLDALWADYRERLLALGSAGRLCLAGRLDVRPLDDDSLMQRARPRLAGGRVLLEPAAAKARAAAMARLALRGEGPVVVVVLGAGIDLTDSIEEQDPRCGYVRVTTRKVAEWVGQAR